MELTLDVKRCVRELDEYKKLSIEVEKATQRMNEIREFFKTIVGVGETLYFGKHKVTVNEITSTYLKSQELALAHPDVAGEFIAQKTYQKVIIR